MYSNISHPTYIVSSQDLNVHGTLQFAHTLRYTTYSTPRSMEFLANRQRQSMTPLPSASSQLLPVLLKIPLMKNQLAFH
jgi:hypothetical protein